MNVFLVHIPFLNGKPVFARLTLHTCKDFLTSSLSLEPSNCDVKLFLESLEVMFSWLSFYQSASFPRSCRCYKIVLNWYSAFVLCICSA